LREAVALPFGQPPWAEVKQGEVAELGQDMGFEKLGVEAFCGRLKIGAGGEPVGRVGAQGGYVGAVQDLRSKQP
jgi:hypothetical protein